MRIEYEPGCLKYYDHNNQRITAGQYLYLQRATRYLSQAEFGRFIGYCKQKIQAWEQARESLSENAQAALLSLEPGFGMSDDLSFRTDYIPRLPAWRGIKALRRLLPARVDDLAEYLEVSPAIIRSWETARRYPSRKAMERMKALLDKLPNNAYQVRYDRWNKYL